MSALTLRTGALAGAGLRARDAARRLPRPPRGRLLLPALAWALVALCAGAYAASVAVPLWYQHVREQRLLIVTSGSMAPSFEAGDAVVLQEVDDPSRLRAGQVVSFWPQGSDDLVTHRIEKLLLLPVYEQDTASGSMVPVLDPSTSQPITRQHLLTRGDANPARDADAVPLSRVRGVVLGVHPGWGAALDWAHSRAGRLTLLGPPLAVLAAMELASMTGARRRPAVEAPGAGPGVSDALLLD